MKLDRNINPDGYKYAIVDFKKVLALRMFVGPRDSTISRDQVLQALEVLRDADVMTYTNNQSPIRQNNASEFLLRNRDLLARLFGGLDDAGELEREFETLIKSLPRRTEGLKPNAPRLPKAK